MLSWLPIILLSQSCTSIPGTSQFIISMANHNVLLDLPSCLQHDICANWITMNSTDQRSMRRLDTALCNRQWRPSLLEIYYACDWECFFIDHQLNVSKKVVWLVARKIQIPSLVLSGFTIDLPLLESFFRLSGSTLKVLKIANTSSAMRSLTKCIASECKVLETLCLEQCNLTMPIADILNRTTTVRELRLQKRPVLYRNRRSNTDIDVKVRRKACLYDRIKCTTVVKLAILDSLNLEEMQSLGTAFPNVADIELKFSNTDVLALALSTWCDLHTLCLTNYAVDQAVAINRLIAEKTHTTLRKLVISARADRYSIYSYASFDDILQRCTRLRSIVLDIPYVAGLVKSISEHCNLNLEELSLGNMYLSNADIASLANHCRNLKMVNIRDFFSYDNYVSLLKNCTKLEKLKIAHGQILSSNLCARYNNIAAFCPNLTVLAIDYPTQACDAFVLPLLDKCKQLHTIEVWNSIWTNVFSSSIVMSRLKVRYVTGTFSF